MFALSGLLGSMLIGTPSAVALSSETPSLAVVPTSTVHVTPNSSTVLTGLSISSDSTENLQATVATDNGTLSMSTTGGLTLSYGNNWSGDQTITYTGSKTDINAGLASVSLISGSNIGSTAKISLTALVAPSGYAYLSYNQHFYKYVAASGISWFGADLAAKDSTFNGQPGYLATIPNDVVNNFVTSGIDGAANIWFGARAYEDEENARTWRWTKGPGESPLAGAPISYCSNITSSCNFVNNGGLYSHWASGEPNNAGGSIQAYTGEYVAVTNWGGGGGNWNDLPPTAGVGGYVIEYGDQAIGSTGFTGVVAASSTVLIAAAPDAPTNVGAVRGNGSATVSFTAPAANGSPITGYTVTTSPGGTTQNCPASPCAITGLSNGTAYTFSLHATNLAGDGPESASAGPVTPATVPDPPTTVSAIRGNGSATVTFAGPLNDGGSAITGYTVQASPGEASAACSTSPCVIGGLNNGVDYIFTVHATNLLGNSVESSASSAVTPATIPDPPTAVFAVRGDGSVSVNWTTPGFNGGLPITGYVVSISPGDGTVTCASSPCHVHGLNNGTAYIFTVHATNAVGNSSESSASAPATPAAVPAAPVSLTVHRGNGSANLEFDPPADNGAAITGYEVSTNGGKTWQSLAPTGIDHLTATLTGLSNGTSYQIAVRAVNVVGDGAVAMQSATPATVPDAPSAVAGLRGDRRASVSWTTPDSDGGSSITGYLVTVSPGEATTSCPSSPCVVTGLTNGNAHTFIVHAINDVGNGIDSAASSPVTPAVAPDAPVGLQVQSGDGALMLSFTAPDNDGGDAITGYEVSVDNGTLWQPIGTSGAGPLTGTVTGLTNALLYPVRVRALNSVGDGTASTAVNGTPATVPGAPNKVAAKALGTRVTVTWEPPSSDGGAPITGYSVVAYPGGATCNTTKATTCTFTTLLTGHLYTFTVRATNHSATGTETGTGTGPNSAASNAVMPIAIPAAPTNVNLVPGDRTLTVTFAPPTDNGGSAITAYHYTTDNGRIWHLIKTAAAGHLQSARITGVLNGSTYRMSVRAVNIVGVGPAGPSAMAATAQWFSDPISNDQRKREIAVPSNPVNYSGPLARTRADSRSFDGTPAYAGTSLRGRQLQPGQAADLGADGLFAFDSATLTAVGHSQTKAVVASLTYDHAVICEGYTDYGGNIAHQNTLSQQRSRAVCAALIHYGADVLTVGRGYGAQRPVIVGGTQSHRTANRRVIILVTQ
jgi:outer membrane protein OmpA-like peptidoglycan-associated protein